MSQQLFDGAAILENHKASWNGMRAELLTMRRGGHVSSDLLTNEHVLFMGVSGDTHHTKAEVEGAPRWEGVKGPGRSAFIPAGRRMRCSHGDGTGTALLLFFDDSAVSSLSHSSARREWQSRPSTDDLFIAANAAELGNALASTDPLDALRAETIATNLVLYIARRHAGSSSTPALGGNSIGRAIELIQAVLPRAASIAELIAATGLSRGRLLTEFKARTGLSPHQYIIQERLNRAKCLLSATNQPLTEIARDVGCANAEHLGHIFRQHLGVSPSAWRRLNGNCP